MEQLRHDDSSVPVQLLVDSSRNCNRESLPEKYRAPRDIAYAIWEIDMGIDEQRTAKYRQTKYITRSGMQKVRILLYHVHHKSPQDHASATVSSIMFMWRDAIEYEVDMVAGDANQAARWFRKDKQKIFKPSGSAIVAVGRMFQEVLNTKIMDVLHRAELRLSLDFISNNSLAELIKVVKGVNDGYKESGTYGWNQSEGLDCLVTAVLSWGHTAVTDLPRKKFTTHPVDYFEQAPSDFAVSLSEHALRFQNHHFWLSEQDMTWHRPMQLYFRASGASKKKKSVGALRKRLKREGRQFNQDWYESPRDNEVGSRHRPIDMLDIHQLRGENLEPFRHPGQQSGSYPNVQFGGSSSSTGR